MPGQRISESDRKKINPNFICTVCKLLVNGAMQTPCGHLLCADCLQTLLTSANPTCPIDETSLSGENVNPDRYTRREIMALDVHCPNEPGCNWSGAVRDLQEHLTSCDHARIQCVHVQCKKEIKRSLLAQHLQQECLYHEGNCDNSKEKPEEHDDVLPTEEHLSGECLGLPGPGRQERAEEEVEEEVEEATDREDDDRNQVSRRDLTEIVRMVVPNGGSDWSAGTPRDLEVHDNVLRTEEREAEHQDNDRNQNLIHVLSSSLVRMVIQMILQTGEGGNVPSRRAELEGLQATFVDLEGKHDQVIKSNRRLEIQIREEDAEITRLRERLDRAEASMAETTVRLSEMGGPSQGQATTRSCNGTLLWRIDDFALKRREGVSGNQTAIYSPHFYSSQFGYKMCARIYMNGDGFGKGSHISLFFVIMKGEHDPLLPWPFQKKITMMLLDQNDGEHNIDAFRSDPESSSFQRPTNNMNVASGSPLFMPLDGLSNRAFVKDDVMFIKIIVD